MNRDLLSKLVAEASIQLEDVRKSRKAFEHSVARVQPFLSKYLSEKAPAGASVFNVCVKGPVCCKRGGEEVLAQLKKLAETHDGAKVVESDCLHRCGRGPNVECGGVVFTEMTPGKVEALFENQKNNKGLAVDLLIDDEYAPDVVQTEEKRCRLLVQADELAGSFSSIEDQARLFARRLPEDAVEKVLDQRLILDALKLHSSIFGELNECEELLKKVIPLDHFVNKVFERDYANWAKPPRSRKKWSFQS